MFREWVGHVCLKELVSSYHGDDMSAAYDMVNDAGGLYQP